MARIRAIKPEFFRHVRLFDAERTSGLPLRLAFAGLWTAADREGRFIWEPRQLKLDCLPHDEIDFGAVLDALCEHGFVQKYEVEGKEYGVIPSWSEHQHINTREAQSRLPEPTGASTCTHVTARGEGKGKEGKGKEGDTSDDVSREASKWQPSKEIVFESGVIRLSQKSFDEWKKAYSNLDLRAELTAIGPTDWAMGLGTKWFVPVSNLLNRRNREQAVKLAQNGGRRDDFRDPLAGIQ